QPAPGYAIMTACCAAVGRWRNGRRSGLKIRRGRPRVGSNPTRPTGWPVTAGLFVVMDLVEHVTRFFHNYGAILTPGSPLLVALSGGPDSLVLLHLMAAAGAAPDDHPLHAAHLDHALRPESAGEA